MSDISRRNLLKGAAVSAVSISAMGLLGACAAPSEPKAETTTDPSADGTGTGSGTNSEYMAEVLEPTSMPDASTASNFNIIYDSKTWPRKSTPQPRSPSRPRSRSTRATST